LADAEPEPLTLANLTTKSLVALIGCITKLLRHGRPRAAHPSGVRRPAEVIHLRPRPRT
jgi:hypothetical protein